MTGRINQKMRQCLSDILIGVINRDARELVEAFISMNTITKNTDINKLETDLIDFTDNYYDVPLKDLKMQTVFPDIINIISENHINIPSDFFLLSKVLITIEGIGKKLSPDFNAVLQTRPFVEDLLKERYSAKSLVKAIKKHQLTRRLFPASSSDR